MEAFRDRLAALERGFPGGPAPAAGPERAQWHRRMAEWLEQRGEPVAAQGHRLRALMPDPPPAAVSR
jgi:hypothetical protein